MKVLIIADIGRYGGALTYLQNLLEFHRKRAVETAILLEKGKNDLGIISASENNGFRIYYRKRRSVIFSKSYFSILYDYITVLKALKDFKPDIIHISNITPGLHIGSFIFNIPIVLTMHTYPTRKMRRGLCFIIGLSGRRYKKIITVSNYSAEQIKKQMGIPESRIGVIYNGIDKVYEYHKREEHIILTLGHFEWYKNPDIWLSVARKVIAIEPGCKFVWLGDGPFLEVLRERIDSDNMKTKIILPGYCSNVQKYYNSASIYFQPSIVENHSYAIIEAMANNLPCVVSNAGGNTESVVDGMNGFVCSPEDIDCFVVCIDRLIKSEKSRKQFGLVGKHMVLEKFSISVQEQKIWEYYNSLIGLKQK